MNETSHEYLGKEHSGPKEQQVQGFEMGADLPCLSNSQARGQESSE